MQSRHPDSLNKLLPLSLCFSIKYTNIHPHSTLFWGKRGHESIKYILMKQHKVSGKTISGNLKYDFWKLLSPPVCENPAWKLHPTMIVAYKQKNRKASRKSPCIAWGNSKFLLSLLNRSLDVIIVLIIFISKLLQHAFYGSPTLAFCI